MPSIKRILIILSATLCLPGCFGFHYQWHHSKGSEQQAEIKSIEGLWTGSWQSSNSKHSGKLRCVICKSSPDSYTFYYRATWARIITGNFKIKCIVNRDNEEWRFSGEKDLGFLGGKFSHSGIGSLSAIQATYLSEKGDKGTFKLKRP
ncbi:MAG: hypothetical protein GY899_14980 [Verrucomicrobiaceae bacterium]|nr:hypothetical protein [Verrucomicrobiaceae bacterium]